MISFFCPFCKFFFLRQSLYLLKGGLMPAVLVQRGKKKQSSIRYICAFFRCRYKSINCPFPLTHPHFRPVITLLLIARSLRLDFPFDLSLELIFIDGNINMNLCILNIRRNMIIQFLLTFSLSLRHSLSLWHTLSWIIYWLLGYISIYMYIYIYIILGKSRIPGNWLTSFRGQKRCKAAKTDVKLPN